MSSVSESWPMVFVGVEFGSKKEKGCAKVDLMGFLIRAKRCRETVTPAKNRRTTETIAQGLHRGTSIVRDKTVKSAL